MVLSVLQQQLLLLLLLLLKSVEFDDDVALLLSVAGLVMGPHVTSESEIGGTDSAALRTSWTCLWLCGSCVASYTSFFRGSDPAIYEAPETSFTDSSPYSSTNAGLRNSCHAGQ